MNPYKILFACALAGIATCSLSADLIHQENFDYPDSTILVSSDEANAEGVNGWRRTQTPTSSGSGGGSWITVNNEAIAFGGSNGQDIYLTGPSSSPLMPSSSAGRFGPAYYGFDLTLSFALDNAGNVPFLALGGANGTTRAGIAAKAVSGGYVLGYGGNAGFVYDDTVLSYGTSYRIVLRYDVVNGGNNNPGSLWIFPYDLAGVNTELEANNPPAIAGHIAGADWDTGVPGPFLQQHGQSGMISRFDNLHIATDFTNAVVPDRLQPLQLIRVETPPVIGDNIDSIWRAGDFHPILNAGGSNPTLQNVQAQWTGLYDSTHLYVRIDVADNYLADDAGATPADNDRVELYFNMDNVRDGTNASTGDNFQYAFNYNAPGQQYGSPNANWNGVQWVLSETEDGYILEVALPWASLGISPPDKKFRFGFDIAVIDNQGGNSPDTILYWNNPAGSLWDNIDDIGTVAAGTLFDGNYAPQIEPIPLQYADEAATTTIPVYATDDNGDAIQLSITDLPLFATFTDNGDGTADVLVNPPPGSSSTYTFIVTASDGKRENHAQLTLIVRNPNAGVHPPQIQPVSDISLRQGEIQQISITASDIDSPSLTISGAGLPDFVRLIDLGDKTATITVEPTATDAAGDYNVTIMAFDGEHSDSTSFTITVIEEPFLAGWHGFPFFDEQLNVDTGDAYLGFINAAYDPWVYLYSISSWGYLHANSSYGSWIWLIGNWTNGLHTENQPWIWSDRMDTWVHVPQPGPDATGAWAWFADFDNLPVVLENATSVTQHNITWTFDQEYSVGTYQDGSWYVIAPDGLQITSISPAWDGQLHGAMLNLLPSSTSSPYLQSFDARLGSGMQYEPSRNAAASLPIQLVPGDCLVSSRGNAAFSSGSMHIISFAALTILDSPPPRDSFRPPYAGTDRTHYGTLDDLNYNAFPKLQDPQVNTPGANFAQNNGFHHLYMDMIPQWPNSSLKSQTSMPNYGRQVAYATSQAALWLCLDLPDETKKDNLRHAVQQGIDMYGLVKAGMRWAPNGGHNNGRKILIAIAGLALGNDEMLAALDGSQNLFQEDGQHDYITQVDVDYTAPDNEPFTVEMLNNWNGSGRAMPEWFSNGLAPNERRGSGAQWNKSYRTVNGGPNTGTALAVELLGLRDAWNDEAFFEYFEFRYWPQAQANRQNALNQIYHFPAAMWDLHKAD